MPYSTHTLPETVFSASPVAAGAKLLLTRDGVTRTVTTIRPARTADAVASLLGAVADHLAGWLTLAASVRDGDLTSLRRDMLQAIGDGIDGRPAPTGDRSSWPGPLLAHELGGLLADVDGPVRSAVRDVLGEMFADVPEILVTGEVTDYTDEVHALLDVTSVLADAEDEEVLSFLNAVSAQPNDLSLLFDYLGGRQLTALERVASRIEATGSPAYLSVNGSAARLYLSRHRPELLAQVHGSGDSA